MSPSQNEPTDDRTPLNVDRRSVLRGIGGGAIAVTALSGTASAHEQQFYGCSQVCSDSMGNEAVVATDDGFECREMDTTSNRQNQDWDHDSHCYEIGEGDLAIVGVIKDSDPCHLCVNPNNCASNYYDDVQDIVDDIENDSLCDCDEVLVGEDCDVTGTGNSGGNGNGNGNGNGS